MTHTQKMVESAIKGGFKPSKNFDKMYGIERRGENWILRFKEKNYDFGCIISINDALLQPSFWQALAKNEGWVGTLKIPKIEEQVKATLYKYKTYTYEETPTWQGQMNSLMPHLQDGGTIETFAKSLNIKNN